RDRDDGVALREQPGERDLRVRDAVLCRDAGDGIDDRKVGGQIFFRVARIVAPPVILGKLVAAADCAGEEAAAERRIGNEADIAFAAYAEDFFFHAAFPD